MENINFTNKELVNILELAKDEQGNENWNWYSSEYSESICSVIDKINKILKSKRKEG